MRDSDLAIGLGANQMGRIHRKDRTHDSKRKSGNLNGNYKSASSQEKISSYADKATKDNDLIKKVNKLLASIEPSRQGKVGMSVSTPNSQITFRPVMVESLADSILNEIQKGS